MPYKPAAPAQRDQKTNHGDARYAFPLLSPMGCSHRLLTLFSEQFGYYKNQDCAAKAASQKKVNQGIAGCSKHGCN